MDSPTFDPEKMRQRIRDELKKQQRTQAAVAKAAKLGHGYLTNILSRNQMPSVDKLDALAKELNVSMPWLMYGIDVPPEFGHVFELMERDPKKFYALLQLLD